MSKAELITSIQKSLGKDTSIAQAERVLTAVIDGIKSEADSIERLVGRNR